MNDRSRLNLPLHRALGCAADAVAFINALQHSDAVMPANAQRNLEGACNALQGALMHLREYAETAPPEEQSRPGPGIANRLQTWLLKG